MAELGIIRTAAFPGRYVQGPGALARLGEEVAHFADNFLLFTDATLPEAVCAQLSPDIICDLVPPACTEAAIAAAGERARATDIQAIGGMGGGKLIDLGRAVADDLGLPFVSVPTVAASDAPCSGLSVIYDANDKVVRDRFVRSNPRLVLVDSAVIAQAPARFLSAGIGDALATFYEADACLRSGAKNVCGGMQTRMAMAVAALCREVIFEYGPAALAQCQKNETGEALEAVIEANILLSGIGFESGGVAAAHAVHHGLADHPDTHGKLHGEKVAFGVLAELALQGEKDEEIVRIAQFNRSVALPVTLAELGIRDKDAALPAIVARATRAGEIIYHEPVEITQELVHAAICRADAIGTALLAAGR